MKIDALNKFGPLAAIEVGGIGLLALGMHNVEAVWALPMILVGSLLLCLGIVMALKFIVASIKSGSKAP